MAWFSIYGYEYTGEVRDVNLTKGTAFYDEKWPCGRCGGAGRADRWCYTGYTCFQCGGAGWNDRTRQVRVYTAEKYAKLEATRAKRNAKKQAAFLAAKAIRDAAFEEKRQARFAEFDAANPGFIARLAGYINLNFGYELEDEYKQPSFLQQMWESHKKWGSLSPNQVAAATKSMDKIDAERASVWIGEVGQRVTLTFNVAKVLYFKSYEYVLPDTYVYLGTDENGNSLKYKSSGFSANMVGEGESITVQATIKAHADYNGVQQTVIQRPKKVLNDEEKSAAKAQKAADKLARLEADRAYFERHGMTMSGETTCA